MSKCVWQVPVEFSFIKKLNDSSYCKDWLRITPYCGCIKPGKILMYLLSDLISFTLCSSQFNKTIISMNIYLNLILGEKCDIRLEVQLESSLEQLYDILVLHLEGGKDVFITVTGSCQRTCFTTSFASLCRMPMPIRQLTAEQLTNAVSRFDLI